jgi:hypothetical protein
MDAPGIAGNLITSKPASPWKAGFLRIADQQMNVFRTGNRERM